MAIALRGAGQTGTGTAGSCSITLSSISGLAQNDVVVVFAGGCSATSTPPSLPAGWTDLGVVNPSTAIYLRAFYKFMGASPDTSVAISGGASGDGYAAVAQAFSGVNAVTPLSVAVTTASNAGAVNPDPPAITPNDANCAILIGATCNVRDTTPGTVTNYTVLDANANATRPITSAAGYRVLSGGSGVAENPAAWSGWSTGAWATMTVALEPIVSFVVTANNLSGGAPALDVPAVSMVVPLPAASDLTTAAMYLETIPAVSLAVTAINFTAPNFATGSPTPSASVMAVIVNATANNLSAGAPVLGQGAFGRNLAASNLADSAPTIPAATMVTVVGLTANNLAAGAPTLGQGAYGRAMTATALADSAPTVPAGTMVTIVNATATSLVAGAPTRTNPAMGVIHNLTATNVSAGAPLPTASVISIIVSLTANSHADSAPTIGTPTMAVIVNAVASNLAAGAPTLPTGTFGQTHAMTAIPLSAGAPTIPIGNFAKIVYDFVAGNIVVSGGIVIGTPTMGVTVLMVASNLSTAPPTHAGATFGQTCILAANSLAPSSPTLGTPVAAQNHVLAATDLAAGAPVLGMPTMVEIVPDLVLGSRVLDAGLDVLRTEADKVLVLTGTPYSYAEAVALSVGENAASFGSPANFTGGRQISSLAVTNGTVTATGEVHRWAAVDTVNSRLLAHGDITGDQETIMGTAWTLDPIVIQLPGSPP